MTSILYIPESMLSEQRSTTQSRLESLPAEVLVNICRQMILSARVNLASSSKQLADLLTTQSLLTFDTDDSSRIPKTLIMEEI